MIKSRAVVKPTRHVQEWLESHPGSEETRLPSDEGADCLVARLYSACLELFRSIVQGPQTEEDARAQVDVLREELGKLFLWGESFESGELDKAIGFASGLHEIVLRGFVRIGQSLLDLRQLSGFLGPGRLESNNRLKTLLQEARSDLYRLRAENQDDDDSSSGNDSNTGKRSTIDNASQIGTSLRRQICHLVRLGPLIRRSLAQLNKHELRLKTAYPPIVTFQVSSAASVYVSMIRDKFKDASKELVERLGEANWQRHQNVRNISTLHEATNSADKPPLRSIFRPVSMFHDSALGTSVPGESLYAPSHTSFLSSNTNGEMGGLRVPSTPDAVRHRKPFECFLCKKNLTHIKNRVDWKMHIYGDLRPYLCTFSGCEAELAQFSSRTEWAEHEFRVHRVTSSWRCQECRTTYNKLTDFEDHAISSHRRQTNTVAWQTALELASMKVEDRAEGIKCPLCLSIPGGSRRTFVNHVTRHMEQIALASLPRAIEDSDDEDTRSDSDSTADTILIPEEPPSDLRSKLSERGTHRENSMIAAIGKDSVRAVLSQPSESTIEDPFGEETCSSTDHPVRQLQNPTINIQTTLEGSDRRHSNEFKYTEVLNAADDQSSSWTSNTWFPQQDEFLIMLRSEGLHWTEIAQKHFPDRSPNACRKRHEGLLNQDLEEFLSASKRQAMQADAIDPRVSSAEHTYPRARPIHSPFPGEDDAVQYQSGELIDTIRKDDNRGEMIIARQKSRHKSDIGTSAELPWTVDGKALQKLKDKIAHTEEDHAVVNVQSGQLEAHKSKLPVTEHTAALPRKPRKYTTAEEATQECRKSGKLFKSSYNWKSHMETHNPDRTYPYACSESIGSQPCTKKFQRKTDLVRHHKSVHLKGRNYQCDLCGHRFVRRDTLRRHNEDGCPKRHAIIRGENP